MRISVIGAGYVGLVTAAALASKGHDITLVEKDKGKIDSINKGQSPIVEEGLDDILADSIKRGLLKATDSYKTILTTRITMICVGTPSSADGSIDLSCVRQATEDIGKVLGKKTEHHTVVVRSTVIPGTTKEVIIPALETSSRRKSRVDFSVVVNPEFMQEGTALKSFFHPDRIIIGEDEKKAGDAVVKLYEGISAPIVRTEISTAEMIKYTSNAFLATKISFINEIGNICQRLGIDVYNVVKGISFDYRIGDRFLNAGIGFGGSCLPKDVRALVQASRKLGYSTPLLDSVLEINKYQAVMMIQAVEQKLGNLKKKHVCVLGLAFKPNTDDIRNAPALRIIEMLLDKGALVMTYDPLAMPNAKHVLPKEVAYCRSAEEAISGCDCILILTEWEEFKDESLYHGKMVFDGRRALDPKKARAFCDYHGICW